MVWMMVGSSRTCLKDTKDTKSKSLAMVRDGQETVTKLRLNISLTSVSSQKPLSHEANKNTDSAVSYFWNKKEIRNKKTVLLGLFFALCKSTSIQWRKVPT